MASTSDFERGLLVGLLIGEGYFGFDRTQPIAVVAMSVRHRQLLRWLEIQVPGSKLYGPYTHRGRNFFRWIIRGPAVETGLAPLLDAVSWEAVDPYVHARYERMMEGRRRAEDRLLDPEQLFTVSETATLDDVVGGYALPVGSQRRFERLVERLVRAVDAPTTIRDPDRILTFHLADSLTGLAVAEVPEAGRIADIGSGAGFPGLPLAVALPRTSVDLVEASKKKAAVIGELIRAAELSNARPLAERVEAWAATEGSTAYDVVTARAVAPLGVVLEYAAPLLRLGGVLVAWQGARDDAKERKAAIAAGALGLSSGEVLRVHPFRDAHSRHLHVFRKVASTPERFPRRPGMAAKRPLA